MPPLQPEGGGREEEAAISHKVAGQAGAVGAREEVKGRAAPVDAEATHPSAERGSPLQPETAAEGPATKGTPPNSPNGAGRGGATGTAKTAPRPSRPPEKVWSSPPATATGGGKEKGGREAEPLPPSAGRGLRGELWEAAGEMPPARRKGRRINVGFDNRG